MIDAFTYCSVTFAFFFRTFFGLYGRIFFVGVGFERCSRVCSSYGGYESYWPADVSARYFGSGCFFADVCIVVRPDDVRCFVYRFYA